MVSAVIAMSVVPDFRESILVSGGRGHAYLKPGTKCFCII